jgi:hypothetical protein
MKGPAEIGRTGDEMADGGAGTPKNDGRPPTGQPGAAGQDRLGNPTRLVPRRQPAQEPVDTTVVPEIVEPDDPIEAGGFGGGFAPGPQGVGGGGFGAGSRGPVGGGFGSMFGPRSLGGGRVQVWGCSPGCLIASILGSLLLTFLLNALI